MRHLSWCEVHWCMCVCVTGLYMCICVCFPVCPCGTDSVGLSADQKGPCVGVEAVEIPLVCACACWLLNYVSPWSI